jgi:hypothetical protein
VPGGVFAGSGLQTHSVSLLGKPLPPLTELGLGRASAKSAGKRALACFWDMNQRPSRNCVRHLVRADGIGLSELDGKINSMNKKH